MMMQNLEAGWGHYTSDVFLQNHFQDSFFCFCNRASFKEETYWNLRDRNLYPATQTATQTLLALLHRI